MSHYQETQKKDLERVIRTQKNILDNHCYSSQQIDKISNYIIDLQNYYKDKYGKYYIIPDTFP